MANANMTFITQNHKLGNIINNTSLLKFVIPQGMSVNNHRNC